jgi:hypothetical protein
MVDADTGNSICGFREKDVLEKWANGEEIPAPPRPKSPPPRPPFHDASKEDEDTWRGLYDAWLADNDHLPDNQRKTSDEILAMPRPKSDPPRPPAPNATDEQLDVWADEYEVWRKENEHLPNLQPAEQIKQRFKAQRNQQPPTPGTLGRPGAPTELKSATTPNLNLSFHYIVERGEKTEVYGEAEYIQSLEHQYYVREKDGLITKVVGDAAWAQKRQAAKAAEAAQARSATAGAPPSNG